MWNFEKYTAVHAQMVWKDSICEASWLQPCRHLKGEDLFPERVMASLSSATGWSCGTLQDGVTYMDLDLEEQRLLKELEAP
jgi:hypothetical protein